MEAPRRGNGAQARWEIEITSVGVVGVQTVGVLGDNALVWTESIQNTPIRGQRYASIARGAEERGEGPKTRLTQVGGNPEVEY